MVKGGEMGGPTTSSEDISVGRMKDGTILLTWVETQSPTIAGGLPYRMRHSVKIDVNDALWLRDALSRTLQDLS